MALHRHHDVVLLLGAPGAGKGTQARFVADLLGIPHVASGDLLREHRQRETVLGRTALEYMDRGDLVPDALVVDMIAERMDQPDAGRGALLDGFPRTLSQAQTLERRLAKRGGKVRIAIYVDVPTDVLVERLSGRWLCRDCQSSSHEVFNRPRVDGTCDDCSGDLYQRTDDKRDVVSNRVAVYLRDTLPVVERYERKRVLLRVDGNQPIEAVKSVLLQSIGDDQAAIPA
jgi:adenylate kinase